MLGRAIVHERLRRVLAKRIAGAMKHDSRATRKCSTEVPADLISAYVASTFVLLLNWWLDKRMFLPPREIDSVFRSLIMPTLAAL